MELVLWRHCEAEQGVPDDARRLTPKGLEQAAAIARWLGPRLPRDARIVVSPAVRAQQTAAALGRPYATDAAVGTGAAVDVLLDAVQWPRASIVVLVVGHQPTLGCTASHLLEGDPVDRTMATGEVLWLDGDGAHARLKARMVPGELPRVPGS